MGKISMEQPPAANLREGRAVGCLYKATTQITAALTQLEPRGERDQVSEAMDRAVVLVRQIDSLLEQAIRLLNHRT